MHPEGLALPSELGMAAGHGDVVEEDVAVRVPPDGDELAVQEEARALVGAAHDHQQGRAGLQVADGQGELARHRRGDIRGAGARVLDLDGGQVHRPGRRVAGLRHRRAALTAEVRVVRVA